MAIDFAMIDASDIVCMMPGWKRSGGATREYEYAISKRKTVWMLHSKSPLELLEYAKCANKTDEHAKKNSDIPMKANAVINAMAQAAIDGRDRLGRKPDPLVIGMDAYKLIADVLTFHDVEQKTTAWGIPLIVAGDGIYIGYMEIVYATGAAT